MRVEKLQKNIDYTKTNIGVELECLLVHTDSLREITRSETQLVFKTLIKEYKWKAIKASHIDEIQAVEKKISGRLTQIKIDLCYAIFEIATPLPVNSLELLEKINKQAIEELKKSLGRYNMMIWPFGVAPSSQGLYNLPFKNQEELIDDLFYKPFRRIEVHSRFCHMTSNQVNIDIPIDKIIPTINAFYKNLSVIIKKFAKSPALIKGKLYREGRYYFWNEYSPLLNTSRFTHGAKPDFPSKPFVDINDFFQRIWKGSFIFVIRDGIPHTFKDLSMTPHRFLKEQKGLVVTPDNKEKKIVLEKNDIEIFINLHWMDFKPHFDFKQNYTLKEFLNFYRKNNLDKFIEKYCQHAYLEIRPCSPHLENNAMDIPRYFYAIFQNLNTYIEKSKNIKWQQAKKNWRESIYF